jgi:hypothetical protein
LGEKRKHLLSSYLNYFYTLDLKITKKPDLDWPSMGIELAIIVSVAQLKKKINQWHNNP